MTDTRLTAAASGTFTLGGDLTINRLGFGSMQLTGTGVWGDRRTPTRPCACSSGPSSSA